MNRLKATNSVPFVNRDIAPATGTPQYATNGDPVGPVPPTIWPAYAFNMIQDELLAVIVAAGLAPDDTNWGQLLQAIQKIGSSVVGSARGLKGSAAGSSAIASWTVTELVAATAIGGTSFTGTALTLNFNGGGTGAGGMDTGAMPASGDLSVYAIYNPTTNTWNTLGCTGAASNGPVYAGAHMPAGYTASTLLWAGVIVSSAFRAFVQNDRTVWLVPISALSGGISNTTYVSLSLSGIVPAITTAVGGELSITTTITNTIRVAGNASGLGRQSLGGLQSSGSLNGSFDLVPLSTAQTLFYLVDVTGGSPPVIIYICQYTF